MNERPSAQPSQMMAFVPMSSMANVDGRPSSACFPHAVVQNPISPSAKSDYFNYFQFGMFFDVLELLFFFSTLNVT